jgi:hypothetical protein
MPFAPTKYRVLKQSKIEKRAKPGTTIYACLRHDYGVARLDTRMLGIKHASFTLDPNGNYPFFTMPLGDVELIE